MTLVVPAGWETISGSSRDAASGSYDEACVERLAAASQKVAPLGLDFEHRPGCRSGDPGHGCPRASCPLVLRVLPGHAELQDGRTMASTDEQRPPGRQRPDHRLGNDRVLVV